VFIYKNEPNSIRTSNLKNAFNFLFLSFLSVGFTKKIYSLFDLIQLIYVIHIYILPTIVLFHLLVHNHLFYPIEFSCKSDKYSILFTRRDLWYCHMVYIVYLKTKQKKYCRPCELRNVIYEGKEKNETVEMMPVIFLWYIKSFYTKDQSNKYTYIVRALFISLISQVLEYDFKLFEDFLQYKMAILLYLKEYLMNPVLSNERKKIFKQGRTGKIVLNFITSNRLSLLDHIPNVTSWTTLESVKLFV